MGEPKTPLRDLNALTNAEMALVEAYARRPCLADIAREFGLTTSCIMIRAKSVRDKLDARTMFEAVEKCGLSISADAQNKPSPWTPEKDALLKDHMRAGKTAEAIAEVLGVSEGAVRGRAARLGFTFARAKPRRQGPINKNGLGHKPFTERCGELLRQAGVRI